MDESSSIWELYGLRANPFSTNPLLVRGGVIPINCFFGRKGEVERIEKLFRSGGGARMLVVGPPGVGKTTFVNFARAKAIENKYFTPLQEIKVQPDWNADDFVLNTISAIYSTLKLTGEKKISAKLKPFVDIYEMADRQGSISIAGTGAGYGEARSFNVPKLTSSALLQLFSDTVSGLLQEGHKEIILHYNNLELFEEDEERLKAILNKIRDFLQTPGVHFVFVGGESLPAAVNGVPRVSAIFQDTPIKLEPLSEEDVLSVIKLRITELRIPGLRVVYPCTDAAVSLLYRLYEGNIRAILNSLATAVLETVKEAPITLDEGQIKQVLNAVAKKRFTSKLSPTMQKVLNALLAMKTGTNKGLSKELGIAPQNMSVYLKELVNAGCIYLARAEGRVKYYSVSDWVKWLALEPENVYSGKLSQWQS